MGDGLKEKTAKGLFWGGLSNGIQQLLNLVFGIFLARLLTPADYGMVGMLAIFSLIAATLQESGFTAALANKKEVKHEDYNAVFWFSLLMGIFLYTILFFLAPFIANFFGIPELKSLARYLFIGFFISSLGVARNAYLFRNLMVKEKSISVLVALFVSGIVGVLMAYLGFAYWGIATQNIVYISVVNICYLYFVPWRPSFNMNFQPLRSMFSFSSKLLVTNIFRQINENVLTVLLGKFYTKQDVGYFNQANKWSLMGHSLVTGMVNSVAQPVLTDVSDEKERQLRVFRKILRFVSFVSFPAMFGLALIVPELITIAITDKWAPSIPLLQILCLGGAFLPIIALYTNLVISKGKSDVYMCATMLQCLLQLLVMLLAYPLGIYMMVVSFVILNISWMFVWHYFVYKEIGLTLFHVIKDVSPFALIAVITMLVTYYLTQSIYQIYLLFIAKIIIAVLIYSSIMYFCKVVIFKECLDYIFAKR